VVFGITNGRFAYRIEFSSLEKERIASRKINLQIERNSASITSGEIELMALGTADAVAGKPVFAISPRQLGEAERWLGLLVRFPDVIR
jgi:hypothetical protein